MMERERICRMTKLAILEKEQKKGIEAVRRTCRSDYIGARMLKNGVRLTAVCLLVLLLWGFTQAEIWFQELGEMNLPYLAYRLLLLYALVMAVGLVLTYLSACLAYHRDSGAAKEYRHLLIELDKSYRGKEGRREKNR